MPTGGCTASPIAGIARRPLGRDLDSATAGKSAFASPGRCHYDPGMLPFTGQEFLDSLRDGREVWIYGQSVAAVTAHPASRTPARMLARLYDALHDAKQREVLTCPTDTGSGGFPHRAFRAPASADEMGAGRDAIAALWRL